MKVLLFDIDGTLLNTSGSGKAAMEAALRLAFRIETMRDTVPYSGRTDQAIGRDLLAVHELETTAEHLNLLTETYLAQLPIQLGQKSGLICPGVVEILSAAKPREDIVLGLLTGNVKRGAQIKLGQFGLWDYFVCGGFGDDHFDRDDVARMALRTAQECVGTTVNSEDVWVIGDTPLDVKCARAIGARAVAVATGWHRLDELAEHRPDVLLPDLTHGTDLFREWGLAVSWQA